MPQGGKQTDISPGVVARVVQAARYAITGVAPDAWFGPLEPLKPMAPESVEGRRFDYPVGYNLDTRRRGYEPVGFDDLRALADGCDILRTVIETRKDQMESQDWVIRAKSGGERERKSATDDQKRRIEQITEFLLSPDRVNSWSQWQRVLLEDRFVIDAATLYKRRDRKGRLFGLEIIDGATIKPLIDDLGRRPAPPDPAYQQILKGIPAVDYTAEEIMYLVRNPRSWKFYGYSEVEQIIISVNTAIRRSMHQLEYYREGSQPDAFGTLPKDWTIDQIKAFQNHFDSMMAGNLASRRKLRFMPGDFKYQEAKQPLLKDAYDEWLARLICFAFSISPEPFVQHQNRATAETSHDRALQEGLQPLQRWIKSFIDPVITLEFDSPDLEFGWVDDREQDPKQAADILVNDTKAGIIAVDEAREAKGLPPLGGAYAVPMLATASGYVAPIDPEEQQARADAALQQSEQDEQHQQGEPSEEDKAKGQADSAGGNDTAKAAYTGLRKRAHKPIPFDRTITRHARAALKQKIAPVLAATGRSVARQVRVELNKVAKDAADDNRKKAQRIALGIDLGALDALTDAAPDDIEAVLADTGGLALAQIGVEERGELVDQVNERAVEYARQRAAEMVGKRWLDDELVDNPDARWRIDEATRNELQSIIEQGLNENLGHDEIADAIENSTAFGEDRAELIANTEIAKANGAGKLEGYKAARDAGVRVMKDWKCDAEACDVCRENEDAGPIGLDEPFPSGDMSEPAHPRCECTTNPVVETASNETEDESEEE